MIKEIVSIALAMVSTAAMASAKEYHVGVDHPLKTISAAAELAQPGDTITVHAGVYRERVDPPRGGTSETSRITYQAAPGDKVVITGAEPRKGWENVGEDFASWIDFAPTFLTLAGVPVPPEFDGHRFLPKAAQPPKYVYSFRDFMDESFDKVRSVRDARYRYVRNLAPGVDDAGEVAYQEAGQTMHELRRVQAKGKLTPIQALYFDPNRPKEQLYDTQSDPWEVKDLAGDPAHAAKLAELRAECDSWLARCGPLADMHADELVQRGIILPRKPISQKPSKQEKVLK